MAESFSATRKKDYEFADLAKFDALLTGNEEVFRYLAWNAYRKGGALQEMQPDHKAGKVVSGKYVSPYVVRQVGKMPEGGWGLVIAMHGGGKAPKQVNDSQWRIMQRYYKDHPEQGGYLYLALRAPTDAWNGFYTGYVYPLIARLIRQLLVCRSQLGRFFSSVIPTEDTEPLPLARKWRIASLPFIARRRLRRMDNLLRKTF